MAGLQPELAGIPECLPLVGVQLVRGRASQTRTATPTHATPTCKRFFVTVRFRAASGTARSGEA